MARDLTGSLHDLLAAGLHGAPRPLFPGAVCGVDDGGTTQVVTAGLAYSYADDAGTPLPPGHCRPVTEDTLFDLASLTKLFTATVVVRLAQQGALGLDDPVARHLTGYGHGTEQSRVTVRQLLTHTSGLTSEVHFWRGPDPQARRAAVLRQPLEARPGTRVRYSCVGYLTLGLLVEQLLGQGLDVAVDALVRAPLGLADLRYRPLTRSPSGRDPVPRDAVAATEMRRVQWAPGHDPDDPDPRGVVHDENAASLGGVAGNAGLFGTARDLLRYGRALLDALPPAAGSATGSRVPGPAAGPWLSPGWARELVRPQLPPAIDPGYRSGLGFRVDDTSFMGPLAGSGRAYGHTGFTGTSLVLDEARDLVVVLLTNRVHPSRTWSTLNPFRRQLGALVASRSDESAADRGDAPQAAWP